MRRATKTLKRALIGIVGGLLLLIGFIAVPYPGPGWVTVFAALALLSTEFNWAHKLLLYARDKYNTWQKWVRRQKMWMQFVLFSVTCIVTVLTLWLLNVYGYTNDIFE
ncbi:MAG: TIGR02611 family protein, partial [Candidatus Saccharimonadales bacterium]